MNTIRTPAVAGLFYPADAVALRELVNRLLSEVEESTVADQKPAALIVPHAGYIYSGAVAARAYAQLRRFRAVIRRVVLLGPNHRVPLAAIAAPGCEGFRTPLGDVPVDTQRLMQISSLPRLVIDDRPHREEHALEVQLPFLQCVLDEFSILPLVVGDCPPQQAAAVIEALQGEDDSLLLISSDLSHYHDYATACSRDARTAQRIEARQPLLRPEDACGARALNGLLLASEQHQWSLRRLALLNSGDTAGSRDRVVGYGAWRVD